MAKCTNLYSNVSICFTSKSIDFILTLVYNMDSKKILQIPIQRGSVYELF